MKMVPKMVIIKWVLFLTLLVLMILSTNFFIAKEREKTLRVKIEEELDITRRGKQIIEERLVQEIKAKEAIQQELYAEQKQIDLLREELQEKDKLIQIALDEMEEKIQEIQELFYQFEDEKNLRIEVETKLQRNKERLTELTEENKILRKRKKIPEIVEPIEIGEIIIKASSFREEKGGNEGSEGRVMTVNQELYFMTINLGYEDNIKKGDVFSIWREDDLIARAQVLKTREKVAAATLLPEYKNAEVLKFDIVKF